MKRTVLSMAVAGLALAIAPAAITATAASAATATHPVAHALPRALNVHLPSTHLPDLKPSSQSNVSYSGNWSGYGDTAHSGVTLRYVQADWNVPSVSCANSTMGSSGDAYNSDWVGLDGLTSADPTVEQTGTTGYCTSTTGAPTYYGWYEMYPMEPVPFGGISPGDAMDASVYFNSSTSSYQLTITDTTTGGFTKVTEKCPTGSTCKNETAEVITEDPGDSAPTIGLADFGQENFTSAQVTSRNGTKGTLSAGSLWSSTQIDMESGSSGDHLANAGPLMGGAAFVDSWVNSL
jgi:hypothetical protein